MTEYEKLFESIALKGQCPDCNAVKLESNGPYVHCRACHSAFFCESLVVRRIEFDAKTAKRLMKTGQVVAFR